METVLTEVSQTGLREVSETPPDDYSELRTPPPKSKDSGWGGLLDLIASIGIGYRPRRRYLVFGLPADYIGCPSFDSSGFSQSDIVATEQGHHPYEPAGRSALIGVTLRAGVRL